MDKNKILGKLSGITTVKELTAVMAEIVNEMPDREPTVGDVVMKWRQDERKHRESLRQAFHDLGEIMGCSEPTVMEQFCKWKEFDRKRTIQSEYLSFAQAIKVLLEDKKSISHVSWSIINRIDPYPNASGFLFWDGASHCSYFHFTTEMLHSGWIVLDR